MSLRFQASLWEHVLSGLFDMEHHGALLDSGCCFNKVTGWVSWICGFGVSPVVVMCRAN